MRSQVLDQALPYRGTLAAYATLTKPGIVALVLVSTLSGIYLASGGTLDAALAFWTLAGVGLATAGSAVLNNYIDRDIDPLMERTASRALARGEISPQGALAFALVLISLSAAILLHRVGPLTAVLTGSAVFIYVVLYAMVLKRRSPAANQVGGLAGALPPLIGYASVTGTLDGMALILFALVAVWQQPHALSLALKYRDEYRKASIPVIPVAKGVGATKARIVFYTLILIPVSAMPTFFGMAGSFYLAIAALASAVYLTLGVRFLRSVQQHNMFLFFYSILYLILIFTVMVIDKV